MCNAANNDTVNCDLTEDAEEEYFYTKTLYQLVQNSTVGVGSGAEFMRCLKKEICREKMDCMNKKSHLQETTKSNEYLRTMKDLYKLVVDSLVSAVHRSAPHELINRSMSDCRIVSDEEEYQFHRDDGYFEIEDYDELAECENDNGSFAHDNRTSTISTTNNKAISINNNQIKSKAYKPEDNDNVYSTNRQTITTPNESFHHASLTDRNGAYDRTHTSSSCKSNNKNNKRDDDNAIRRKNNNVDNTNSHDDEEETEKNHSRANEHGINNDNNHTINSDIAGNVNRINAKSIKSNNNVSANDEDTSTASQSAEIRQRRRDELKRKREQDEDLLLNERKVIDEKGCQYRTIGPFPVPRLSVRVAANTFLSRKALQHRTVAKESSSTSSSSESESVETSSYSSLETRPKSSELAENTEHERLSLPHPLLETEEHLEEQEEEQQYELEEQEEEKKKWEERELEESCERYDHKIKEEREEMVLQEKTPHHYSEQSEEQERLPSVERISALPQQTEHFPPSQSVELDAKEKELSQESYLLQSEELTAHQKFTNDNEEQSRQTEVDKTETKLTCEGEELETESFTKESEVNPKRNYNNDINSDKNNITIDNVEGNEDDDKIKSTIEESGKGTAGKNHDSDNDAEAEQRLLEFLSPLSTDSLKKVGESAKAKIRPSCPHDEFVNQIVRTAVRLGCEKACMLMDKKKIIEDMTNHVQTGTLSTTASIDFLNTLPDNLKSSLSQVLNLPREKPNVREMWERMVAMGFLSVLTNLRLRPLKKIANELSVVLPNSNSTEKFCEALVFAAFPREKERAKCNRLKQKYVKFTVPPEGMFVKGDMGYITFKVENVSLLADESNRHYSPEFVYASLKWSLLCMVNKESLALYLCQMDSVHCKFVISVINQLDEENTISNEGTQSFSAFSQENDWGFNNVIRMSDLLDPEQGFVRDNEDAIIIEVRIVLVEPLQIQSRDRSSNNKGKKNTQPKVNENAMRELLEDEKAEALLKRLRQETTKLLKEEDKSRKQLFQEFIKWLHNLSERMKRDTKRLIKDIADRERREELERQRVEEKIKLAKQETMLMHKRLEDLREENKTLTDEERIIKQEINTVKQSIEKNNEELEELLANVHRLKLIATEQQQSVNHAQSEQSIRKEKVKAKAVNEHSWLEETSSLQSSASSFSPSSTSISESATPCSFSLLLQDDSEYENSAQSNLME